MVEEIRHPGPAQQAGAVDRQGCRPGDAGRRGGNRVHRGQKELAGEEVMDRRTLLKTSLAMGGLSGLGACAAPSGTPAIRTSSLAVEDRVQVLAPIRAHPDRIFDI